MTYIPVGIRLPTRHMEKIKEAVNTGNGVKLRLGRIHLDDNSPHSLLLTKSQVDRLHTGGLHDVTIPHSRLVKHGGFLPFLLPLLGGLGALAGISGGIATTVAKAKEAQLADARRAAIGKAIRYHYSGKRLGSCAGNPLLY